MTEILQERPAEVEAYQTLHPDSQNSDTEGSDLRDRVLKKLLDDVLVPSDTESTASGPASTASPSASDCACGVDATCATEENGLTHSQFRPRWIKILDPKESCCQGPREIGELLLTDLEGGGFQRGTAMDYLDFGSRALHQSFTKDGCRAVQRALALSDNTYAASLSNQFQGHIEEALQNGHANYVLQKIVEKLPGETGRFVAMELRGVAVWAAKHEYGCRVLCRIYEHCAASEDAVALTAELMPEVYQLSCHRYGHHVIQACLKHNEVQRRQMVEEMSRHVETMALDKNGSFVVETMVYCCDPDQRESLTTFLFEEDRCGLAKFISTPPGLGLLRAMVEKDILKQEYIAQLLRMRETLLTSNQGKRLLKEVEGDAAVTHEHDSMDGELSRNVFIDKVAG